MKTHLNYHKKSLDELAEFILLKIKVDVREKTDSRAFNLPYYRAVFFNIYLHTHKISYELLGNFLNKDHSSVCHAIKLWDNFLKDEYKFLLIEYKAYKQLISKKECEKQINNINSMKVIDNLTKQIKTLKHRLSEKKELNLTSSQQSLINDISELSHADIIEFKETRLKPYVRMIQSRKKPIFFTEPKGSLLRQ